MRGPRDAREGRSGGAALLIFNGLGLKLLRHSMKKAANVDTGFTSNLVHAMPNEREQSLLQPAGGVGLGNGLCQAPETLMTAALEGSAAQTLWIFHILRLKLLLHMTEATNADTGAEPAATCRKGWGLGTSDARPQRPS